MESSSMSLILTIPDSSRMTTPGKVSEQASKGGTIAAVCAGCSTSVATSIGFSLTNSSGVGEGGI